MWPLPDSVSEGRGRTAPGGGGGRLDGRGEDDLAGRSGGPHDPRGGLGGVQRAKVVDGGDLLGLLGRHVERAGVGVEAGVDDDDVEAAERGGNAVGGRLDRDGVGDVAGVHGDMCRRPARAQLVRAQLCQRRRLRRRVDQRQRSRARLRVALRDREADPAGPR